MTKTIRTAGRLLILLVGITLALLLTVTNAYAQEADGFTENGLHYYLYTDNGYAIDNGGSDSIVHIPQTINGLPVIAVHEAFQDNHTVTEVSLPETVTEVSERCFENCSNLRKLHMGGVKKVVPDYHQWENVIYNCPNLETLTFGPSAELAIQGQGGTGGLRFSLLDTESWNHLKHISISGKMSDVPESFFYGKGLETIEIGSGHSEFSSIDNILYSADGKTLLVCGSSYQAEHYVIPEGVTTLGHIGFDSCSNLKTITIPRSVTTVNHAFAKISPILYVYKGSAAEEYAAKYGMEYRCYNENGVLEIPVTRITLSQTEAVMKAGETLQMTAVCTPSDADDKTIEWKSIFPSVAEVSANGLVTAKSSGTALIVASAPGGYDIEETCRIEVTGEISDPENPIEPTNPTIPDPTAPTAPTEPNPDEPSAEEPEPADPTTPPAVQKIQTITGVSAFTKTYGSKPFNLGASAKTQLTYKSGNPAIATVNARGLVTLKAPGKAVITIKAAETSDYKAAVKKVAIIVKPKKIMEIQAKSTKAKTLKISWKRDAKASGYQVQISQNSKFTKGNRTTVISKNKTTSTTFKLARGKTYYAKVRAYKKVGTTKLYGAYSKVKSIRIK